MRKPPDASWRIVPAPRAGFQSQLISRTTPIFSPPDPAEFQTQAPPHAILKAEGNTNVPRAQHAVSPEQPDQARPERRCRRAIDDFYRLESPASKNCETNPIPFSNTRKARERNLRNEPNFEPNPNKMKPLAHFAKRTQFFGPGPPYLALTAAAAFEHPASARAKFTKRTQFRPQPERNETTCTLAKRAQFFAPGPPYVALTAGAAFEYLGGVRERFTKPNFSPIPNKKKPFAPLRNEPNSRPPAPRTSRSQPAPLSNTWQTRERDLRNEPNSDPNPNKMKPLAPFAKRTQFPPGPRSQAPRTKLIAIAMPASQPL
jgi:hypothetical protein